ncbi:MAG: hypothetical protein COT35_12335 [Nitrospirae bacterium CG08_land_8_20_14_0_20_52_24]|nr:MAG: hypothetical protein COT35_12335 [Nitrospirae bacterium CG08_land_8_20_14_0_20_52_24]
MFFQQIPRPLREGVWGRGNLKGENDSPSPCPWSPIKGEGTILEFPYRNSGENQDFFNSPMREKGKKNGITFF